VENIKEDMTQRILITSALPYINGIKHLGNLVGSMLPADVYARFCRQRGHETLFICGTDEHGTPAELAALAQKKPVAEYCQEMHALQKELYDKFSLSFDWFGRSSSPTNHAMTQYFAHRLFQTGLIKGETTKQVYSPHDHRFLPDRYIEGTCPHCGYEKARGDQCDLCTRLLDTTELLSPRSAVSGATNLEVRETQHLFFLQSEMQQSLRKWIAERADHWPHLTKSIAEKWLNDDGGLRDRGITRDLDWGIPVAWQDEYWPGMDKKVFYVWFDAPIAYISATQEWVETQEDKNWERWWRCDKGASDVYYVQFMAKDNVPFHTLSFPATLMGTGEDWKLADNIMGYSWLTYRGGKFSTSQKRGVFMDKALECCSVDYWRWWLMSHIPETRDTDFDWLRFQNDVNKDLADNIGNFVNRVIRFCDSKFEGRVPENDNWEARENDVIEAMEQVFQKLTQHMNNIALRKATSELRHLWSLGNEYFQESAPWAALKTDFEKAASSIRLSLGFMRLYAITLAPFLPETAEKMVGLLNLPPDTLDQWPTDVASTVKMLNSGHKLSVPRILFQKITDEQRQEFEEKFG
jgi:methionyl-tRNA synthetase